jgi:molecular chaperone Hsp33
MSELHKFLFDGLPVRGMVVRLTDAWTDLLQRRASNTTTGAYPAPLQNMLGEMTAAAVLMQANIKFDGALVLQIFGDGPVKIAVVEVQSDLSLRATATLSGTLNPSDQLSHMVNQHNQGRCAITLDPKTKFPGQQPYQGVVPLFDDQGLPIEHISAVLQHYMLQSEQLDTTLVLAANDSVAAGLLIQRLPLEGAGNLAGSFVSQANEDAIGLNEHYNRIAMLANTLSREELLSLDVDSLLRRLFWQETLTRFEPLEGPSAPRFACACSRARVGKMVMGLGQPEAQSILDELGNIDVACEFCGKQYRFDPIDVTALFLATPGSLLSD